MGYKFNPFTSNLDEVGGSSPYWLAPVNTRGDLPVSAADGAAVNVLAEDSVFVYDSGTSEWHNTRLSVTQFAVATNPEGISIDNIQTGNVNDYRVNLHPASSTTPGGVSTGTQNFAGDKTFDNDVTVTGDLTVNGTTTTVNSQTLEVADANITINNGGDQATADLNDAGLTIEMSDATDVVLGYDSTLTSRIKLGDVGDEREIVTVSHLQTITNKNLKNTSNLLSGASADDFVRETGNQQVVTIPDTTIPDNFVLENFTQTLNNKTLDNSNSAIFLDTNLTIQDNLNNTKQANFELSNITAGTTRLYSLPDTSDTLVTEAHAQNITNKTLLEVDNIRIDGNTVSSINTDGNIILDPNGAGNINASTSKIINVADPVDAQDAATKNYVDTIIPETNNLIEGGEWSVTSIPGSSVSTASHGTGVADQGSMDNINSRSGQSFLTTTGGNISSVDFDLRQLTGNATGNMVVDLYADDGTGSPGVLLGTSDAVDVSTITNIYSTKTFTFSLAINLASSTLYHAIMNPNGVTFNADQFRAQGANGNPYIDGERIESFNAGSSWFTSGAIDLNFNVNVLGPSGLSLSNSLDAFLQKDGFANDRNTIQAQTISLIGNEDIVYVTVNNTLDSTTNLVVTTAELASTTLGADDLIIATKYDSGIEIGRKLFLKDGESARLKKGLELPGILGDLDELEFNINNNQATLAAVSGLAFDNSITRSAEILYSITIDATIPLYEVGKLMVVQRASDWVISHTTTGDNSQLTFDINSSGEVQYTSANYPGFVSGLLKARAITTSI